MKKIGVIIGRFQVASLHIGHKHLIDTAKSENDQLLILLGSGGSSVTSRNPLPFSIRKKMVLEEYPDAHIYEVVDSPYTWSERVDEIISTHFPTGDIRLYGSRDSFAPYYFGKYPIVHVEALHEISGTDMRTSEVVPNDHISFRQGIIAGQKFRYPTSYQTTDIAILNANETKILLGKKKGNGDKWCLIGGFVDPTDNTLEDAARRELHEEVKNIEISDVFTYIGSHRVADHRYRNEPDKIMTALFITHAKSEGSPCGADDIDDVRWFLLDEARHHINMSHTPLVEMVIKYLTNKNSSQ